MFKKLDNSGELEVEFTFNGISIKARQNETIASALLAAGQVTFRTTSKGGDARGPFCMMGTCFECIVEIDGETRRQACLEPVREGLRVTSIEGEQ